MNRLTMAAPEMPEFPWFSASGPNLAMDLNEQPVSLIRAILRSGYRDQLPVNEWSLQEYIALDEPNPYGDTVLAQVRYGRTYVTCWGGRLTDDGRIKWSCYAD